MYKTEPRGCNQVLSPTCSDHSTNTVSGPALSMSTKFAALLDKFKMAAVRSQLKVVESQMKPLLGGSKYGKSNCMFLV